MGKKAGIITTGVAGLILVAAAIGIASVRHRNTEELVVYADTFAVEPAVPRLYGIAIDSFEIETGTILRNQTLGQLLNQYSTPDGSMEQLLAYSGNEFDVRKVRMGNNYTAFLSPDSIRQLKYLVYEHSQVEYVVFDFHDSLKVQMMQKEILTRHKTATGRIESSLWETITRNNINQEVVFELSEIYAWTIDFFGLQPEDSFSIIYDEHYVDTVSVGLGDVHAAYFRHGGRDLYAIPFVQDSVEAFFDAEGNSLRRAFLKAPLKMYRISSRYSNARLHPILKIVRPHLGVDYAAPVGTPVYSIGDGRVTSATYDSGNGRIVRITHNSVYSTAYLHLSRFAEGIRAGVYVKQGDVIGYVGSSGLSTGPHLDFRVYRNGSPIDPLKMESPPVDPVKPENMMAFDSVRTATISQLHDIGLQGYRIDVNSDM